MVADCTNKGQLVAYCKGSWGRAPQENFEILKPLNEIFITLGTQLSTKEHVFHSRLKDEAFIQVLIYQPDNQFL